MGRLVAIASGTDRPMSGHAASPVRRPLWWALAAAALASAWLQYRDEEAPPMSGAVSEARQRTISEATPADTFTKGAAVAEWPRQPFLPATRDPFRAAAVAPPAPEPMPAMEPSQAAPAPAVQPAPTPTFRFAGRFTDPDGSTRVYLARQGTLVAAEAGVRLPDGFEVQSVSDHVLTLRYPAFDVRATIPLPPSQDEADGAVR